MNRILQRRSTSIAKGPCPGLNTPQTTCRNIIKLHSQVTTLVVHPCHPARSVHYTYLLVVGSATGSGCPAPVYNGIPAKICRDHIWYYSLLTQLAVKINR